MKVKKPIQTKLERKANEMEAKSRKNAGKKEEERRGERGENVCRKEGRQSRSVQLWLLGNYQGMACACFCPIQMSDDE